MFTGRDKTSAPSQPYHKSQSSEEVGRSLKPATATACHKTIADDMAIGFMYRIIGLCRLAGTTSHPGESVPLLWRRLWRDRQFWRGVVCPVHFAVRKQQGEMANYLGMHYEPGTGLQCDLLANGHWSRALLFA